MTDKELRKLSRAQLLELLLVQSQELDRLRDELADAKEQLENRELTMERCGSIAEASLALTQIFENAQRAADQYLENVKQRAGQDDAPAADKPLPVQPQPEPATQQPAAPQPQPASAARQPDPTDVQNPINSANIQEPQNHHEQKTNDTAKGQAPLHGAAGTGTFPGEKPEEAWKSAPKHRIHPSVSSRRSHSGGNFISACHAYLRKLHGPDSKRGRDRGVSKRK